MNARGQIAVLKFGKELLGRRTKTHLAAVADDTRPIAVTQKPASIVRGVRPSSSCTGIGQGRFACARISGQQETVPVPAYAGGMKPGDIRRLDQGASSGLDEVITQVFGMLQCGIIQPDQAKAMFVIADGMVMGIGYDREKIVLRTQDRGRWAPGRSSLADHDADLQQRIRVKLTETAPAIVDDRQDGLFVGDDFDSEAKRIDDGTIRERDLAL